MPTSGPNGAWRGARVLATDLDGNTENNVAFATSWAEAPPVDLAGTTQPTLMFSHWVDIEAGYDGYHLEISADDGLTWALLPADPAYDGIARSEPVFTGRDQTWQAVLADLTPWVGEVVRIRAAFGSDGSVTYAGVYLDDWRVDEAANLPVEIATSSLPNATVGVPYTAALDHFGGSGQGYWTLVSGTNAGWLYLDPVTGVIAGTPQPVNQGPVTVTVRFQDAQNLANSDTVSFDFSVGALAFYDDLEASCGTWTLGGDWQCGTPTSGPNGAYSGSAALGTNLAGNYSNNQAWNVATATSAPIQLGAGASPELRFQVWMHTEGSTYDGFNVKASNDGGATWTQLTGVSPAYTLTVNGQAAWGGNASGQGWTTYAADLSAWAGQQIQVQFGFRTDSSVTYAGVYIDDVTVVE